MGLFDKLKKKENKDVVKNEEKIVTTGWNAITEECEKSYPTQKDPKHYGTLVKWRFGGNDPLDGISIYDAGDYWHFVTYGLSELYEKVSENNEYSGYGMEFTFKLKKDKYENDELEIKCICGILQSIARMTFTRGDIFEPFQFLYTGQTTGIDAKMKSNITGFITVPDDKFKSLNTQNGKVEFVEFIGVTNNEIEAVKDKRLTSKELFEKIGSDVTDYNRESII